MKSVKQLINFIIFFICINAFSQNISDNLLGHWKFIKTIDKDGNEINEYDRNGNIVKANGPDITFKSDSTYTKKFTEVNIDKGRWKLLSEKVIEFEMIIPKNSEQGKLITLTQKFISYQWKEDNKGNFLDSSKDTIIKINDDELEFLFEKKYIQLFKKVK